VQAAEHKLPAPLPEFKTPEQLVVWRKEMMAKAAAADALAARQAAMAPPPAAFYTGKPYIEQTGSYAFKFRQYDPELNRWTSADPSGFPDGANNQHYDPVPNSQFDSNGLETRSMTDSGIWSKLTTWDMLWTAVSASVTSVNGETTSQNVSLNVTASSSGVVTSAVQSALGVSSSTQVSYTSTIEWRQDPGSTQVSTTGTQASQYVPYIPDGWRFDKWIVQPTDALTNTTSQTFNINSYTQMITQTEAYAWSAQYQIIE
jgi:RHS repeat-associated protein